MHEGFLSQGNAISKMEYAEASISWRNKLDYEELTMQIQIKKFLMYDPNICLLD